MPYNGLSYYSGPILYTISHYNGKLPDMWFYYKGLVCCPTNFKNFCTIYDSVGQKRYYDIKVSYEFVFGSWDCPTSPYGVCVYNHLDDEPHDFCVFCGSPEERK